MRAVDFVSHHGYRFGGRAVVHQSWGQLFNPWLLLSHIKLSLMNECVNEKQCASSLSNNKVEKIYVSADYLPFYLLYV